MAYEIDGTIISKAMEGDQAAFEQIVYAFEKKVYNIAYRMFGNEHDALDASQEIFIKLYKNIHHFKFNSSFSTWFHRMIMNTCIDEYRKKNRQNKQAYSLDEPIHTQDDEIERQQRTKDLEPEELFLKKEKIKEIQRALSALKEEHRAMIILRDVRGHSYEEISQILDCSIGTVKSRISRARSSMKKELLLLREQKT